MLEGERHDISRSRAIEACSCPCQSVQTPTKSDIETALLFESILVILLELPVNMDKKPQPSDRAFDPATNSYVLLYSPPSGFCDRGCVDCKDQFRTLDSQCMDRYAYENAFSPAEAQQTTQPLVRDINSDLIFLRDAVERHGNTILSRVSCPTPRRVLRSFQVVRTS